MGHQVTVMSFTVLSFVFLDKRPSVATIDALVRLVAATTYHHHHQLLCYHSRIPQLYHSRSNFSSLETVFEKLRLR